MWTWIVITVFVFGLGYILLEELASDHTDIPMGEEEYGHPFGTDRSETDF